MEDKVCLECENPIKGRSDKRFCDDACRNAYNNRRNSDHNNLTRKINNALRKNSRILEEVLGNEKMTKIQGEALRKKGFNFEYHTHHLHTSKGQTYLFVYEYGYLPLESNQYLIVKNKFEK